MAVELVSRTETSAYLRILREGTGQVDCQLYRVSDDAYITQWSWSAGSEWLYPVGSYINFDTVDTGVTLTENTNYEVYYRAGNGTWKSFYFKTLPDTYTRTKTLSGTVRISHTDTISLDGQVKIYKQSHIEGGVMNSGTYGGFGWGGGLWGGAFSAGMRNETEIAGQVRIQRSYDTSITGRVQIKRSEQTSLSGQVRIEKTQQSDISGQVTVYVPGTTYIGGQVCIKKTASTTISGKVVVVNTNHEYQR